MKPDADQVPRTDQTADLEKSFIEEYLAQRGETIHSVQSLPEEQRHAIMREASLHASMRLSEVQSRAHYVDDLKQR
jgi:hypothetical protein